VAVSVAVNVSVGVEVGVSVGDAVLVAVAVGVGVASDPTANPTSFTWWPLPLPPRESFPVSIVPCGLRAAEGLKVTIMLQVAFGASMVPQVLAVTPNGPLVETGWMLISLWL
jgi:hypothetical protein